MTQYYDVAISYAAEDRSYAEQLAGALRTHDVTVFYDDFEKERLWGKNLNDHLIDVYQNQARYCVLLLSRHYAAKQYTNLERQAAQARALQQADYLLPVRLDDAIIPGMLSTVAYVQWPPETAETLAVLVLFRLGKIPPALALLSRHTLEEMRTIFEGPGNPRDKTMFASLHAFKELDTTRDRLLAELDDVDRRRLRRMELREQMMERGDNSRMAELAREAEVDTDTQNRIMQQLDDLNGARRWFLEQMNR